MQFRTPKELVEALRGPVAALRDAAWRELDWLCRPVILELVLAVRKRFHIEEEPGRFVDRVMRWLSHYLASREPSAWDDYPGTEQGWRRFRNFLLLKAAKLFVWDLGEPPGAGIPPGESGSPTPVPEEDFNATLALGAQTRYEFRRFGRPLERVSGDTVGFVWIDDKSFWVLLADASGKGPKAYVLAQGLSLLWTSPAASEKTPGEVLVFLQQHLEGQLPEEMFLETVVARFDSTKVTVAPAGHIRILVRKAGSAAPELWELGGGFLGMEFPELQVGHQESRPFHPGDELTMASDGLYDQPCGDRRLRDVLLEALAGAAQGKGLHEDVLGILEDALRSNAPCDDISVATVRRL